MWVLSLLLATPRVSLSTLAPDPRRSCAGLINVHIFLEDKIKKIKKYDQNQTTLVLKRRPQEGFFSLKIRPHIHILFC